MCVVIVTQIMCIIDPTVKALQKGFHVVFRQTIDAELRGSQNRYMPLFSESIKSTFYLTPHLLWLSDDHPTPPPPPPPGKPADDRAKAKSGKYRKVYVEYPQVLALLSFGKKPRTTSKHNGELTHKRNGLAGCMGISEHMRSTWQNM